MYNNIIFIKYYINQNLMKFKFVSINIDIYFNSIFELLSSKIIRLKKTNNNKVNLFNEFIIIMNVF